MTNRNTVGTIIATFSGKSSRKELVGLLKAIDEDQQYLVVQKLSQLLDEPIGRNKMKDIILSIKEGCTSKNVEKFLNRNYDRLNTYGLLFLFTDDMEKMLKPEIALARGKAVVKNLKDRVHCRCNKQLPSYIEYDDTNILLYIEDCNLQIKKCNVSPTIHNILFMNELLSELLHEVEVETFDFPISTKVEEEVMELVRQVMDM